MRTILKIYMLLVMMRKLKHEERSCQQIGGDKATAGGVIPRGEGRVGGVDNMANIPCGVGGILYYFIHSRRSLVRIPSRRMSLRRSLVKYQ